MLEFQYEDQKKRYDLQIHRIPDSFNVEPHEYLSEDELTQLSKFTNKKRISEFLFSRFILKMRLVQVLGLPAPQISFETIGDGKLVLGSQWNSNIDFNISHSQDLVAVAFSSFGQIGIDIEKTNPLLQTDQIAFRYFSTEEAQVLKDETDPQKRLLMFSKLWCGKEAVVKAAGSGIFTSIGQVIINPKTGLIQSLPPVLGELGLWDLKFFTDLADYTFCVAFKSKETSKS